MTAEAWDFLGKALLAIPGLVAAYISWRNSKGIGHIQDGLKDKADDASKKSADADIVVAQLTGHAAGLQEGRDQMKQSPPNDRRQP